MTIFGTLEIGRSALRAQHKGMETSGQNVANANTPGYSRQRVDMNSVVPASAPGTEMSPGRGVEVTDVTRIKNEFYHSQMMDTGSRHAHWEKRQETIRSVENIMREPGDQGLNQYLGEFFDGWNELSANPESSEIRNSLQENAITLTSAVEDSYERLSDLKAEAENELHAQVEEINEIAEEIVEINEELDYIHNVGEESNELKDHLDLLLEDLSEKIDIRTSFRESGAVNIYAGGQALVQEVGAYEMELGENEEGEAAIITPGGQELNPASGEVRGTLESFNEIIPGMQEDLDEIVETLVEEINQVHENSYGLNGETGQPFFEPLEEDGDAHSRQFRLSEEIMEDPSLIAASSEEGQPGNGQAALEIAGLRDEELINDSTLSDHYRGIISALGVEGRESERMAQAMEKAEAQFREQHEAVAGVNMDEEMLDMVQFQHAWQGASRFLSYVDQMIDVLFMELR